MLSIKKKMDAIVLFLSMCIIAISYGFRPILLVGPYEKTYPLAKHYSDFYNVPLFEKMAYMCPPHFIMISEKNDIEIIKTVSEDALAIDIGTYPHLKKTNPNYFISWIKQKQEPIYIDNDLKT